MKYNRRTFLKDTAMTMGGLGILSCLPGLDVLANTAGKPFFKISLAEWSLHRTLKSGKMTNMDFPAKAKNDFGIQAVEYVDQYFSDKARDQAYLAELNKRAADLGVRNALIMVDTAGALAETNDDKRLAAVENHYQWIDAAKFLGCHSIRVNLRGQGAPADLSRASIDSLGRLSEYGAKNKIGVVVENHGGVSSDGKWLVHVMKQVNNPYCGTLPDFDNWCVSLSTTGTGKPCENEYDRYLGTQEMMPFARGVSAKSRSFDAAGNEINIDFDRLLRIVKAGKTNAFQGYIGIEYAGNTLGEDEGIMATKKLLQRIGNTTLS
ncbi:MAG TPA: TIM barrel protein [Chitinophaga sp.]